MTKCYINRCFDKDIFLKSMSENIIKPMNWPDYCHNARVYYKDEKDSGDLLYMEGTDGQEYFCLFAWTKPEN